jgi:hypothetical protein
VSHVTAGSVVIGGCHVTSRRPVIAWRSLTAGRVVIGGTKCRSATV